MLSLRAQGATEYLVLLAVVLVIALVGIALLGFFPGTASDAQIAESQIYWKSASPIAVVETGGAYYSDTWGRTNANLVYFRIRNTGMYPIRLSKMLGGGNELARYFDPALSQYKNITDIYLAPGEESCFGHSDLPGTDCAARSHSWRLVSEAGATC